MTGNMDHNATLVATWQQGLLGQEHQKMIGARTRKEARNAWSGPCDERGKLDFAYRVLPNIWRRRICCLLNAEMRNEGFNPGGKERTTAENRERPAHFRWVCDSVTPDHSSVLQLLSALVGLMGEEVLPSWMGQKDAAQHEKWACGHLQPQSAGAYANF
jgi:hypothetical protein